MANVNPELAQHRFTLHGPIRIWDLEERRLSLGERSLWLAPDVSTSNLELGTEVVAKGYEEEHGKRWIVDALTITRAVESWRRRPLSRAPRPRV
jgi:hypothetical protein